MNTKLRMVLFGVLLFSILVFSSVMTLPASAASNRVALPQIPASVPGCADSDYPCGYLKGFARGRIANELGLCAQPQITTRSLYEKTASEQGFEDGFKEYCPSR